MKKFYTAIVIFTIIFFGLLFLFPLNNTFALIGGFSVPFGGIIMVQIPCTCSVGTLLIVGPPAGGEFILTPASKIYRNFSPFPSNWVLGLANGIAPCLVGTPPACFPVGRGPLIRIMGTN